MNLNTLIIKKAGITELHVDCIVNAANSTLSRGGGVCGAIFAAAGPDELEKACSRLHGCPTGSAVMTPGFRLPAKYIAHAVGPRWNGGRSGEPDQLYSCYQSVLSLAREYRCRSIAFPLISSGIFGYPRPQAWEVAIRSISDFFAAHEYPDLEVTIAVLDEDALRLGNAILAKFRNAGVPEQVPAQAKRAGDPFPHTLVCDLAANDSVAGFYILQSASLRTTAAGKSFLSAVVSDRTGSVNLISWDYSGPIRGSHDGKIVFLMGQVSEFKGSLQITAEKIRLSMPDDEIEPDQLVPSAPINVGQMYADILDLTETIRDPEYQAVCREFLTRHSQSFKTIPAAKSVHHSFLHGLLMHTGNMLKTADFLAGLYPRVINRDLLLTGTLLHDFSKREEFSFSELGLVSDYSVKGNLLGHPVMVAREAGEICRLLDIPEKKSVLLQHVLLSHHGKPEYGAAVSPLCAEAELLYLIDNVDSRMEIYREQLEQTPLNAFSDRVFALDGRRVYHHYDPDQS